MGQLDNYPENPGDKIPNPTEALLNTVTQELERLKSGLLDQLNHDVEKLRAEKASLEEEIAGLQSQRQQQIAQQQQMLRQLAQGLANQLQGEIAVHLHQTADSHPPVAGNSQADYKENAYQVLAALDSTLRATFDTLQNDLNSYRSSLSQQLRHMHSLEQQGELILDALVSRLRDRLHNGSGTLPPLSGEQNFDFPPPDHQHLAEIPITPEPEPIPAPPAPAAKPQKASAVQLGFVFIIGYAVLLSFFNVVVAIIQGKPKMILGMFQLGGFIQPGFGNSLLILWLRMLVVVPAMAVLAKFLYPKVFQDIRKFGSLSDTRLVVNVIGSGFFLFLSQVLIYIALGDISPGVAITVFFIYPIVTLLSAWLFFGDRPSNFRGIVAAVIFVGIVLISLPSTGIKVDDLFVRGLTTAAFSGITFAFYVLLTQASAKKLHPVPFSLINFIVILVCTCAFLMVLPPELGVKVNPDVWPSLIWSGVILGVLTLVSYLLNNIGISMIGAAKASLLGSSGPVLTALFAYIIIGRALSFQQALGMLIVTVGVTALSFEKMLSAPPPPGAKPAK